MEVLGKIKEFLTVESGISAKTQKEWKKQNFIVANNDGYEGREQLFCFEVFGEENVEKLTQYNNVGDDVKVLFNISTNEYKGKYYTSLKAWRVEKVTAESEPTEPAKVEVIKDTPNDDSGLPF